MKNADFSSDVRAFQRSEPVYPFEWWPLNELPSFEASRNYPRQSSKEVVSITTMPMTEKEWSARLMQAQSVATAKEHGLKSQRNQLQLQLELGSMREALLESRLW